jgi:hypothetical protein
VQQDVDCVSDPEAFDEAFNSNLHLTRVAFKLTGACDMPKFRTNGAGEYLGGAQPSAPFRTVYIFGECTTGGTTASLTQGPEVGLSMIANNGGVLFLQCFTLIDVPSLSAFASGYLRLDGVRAIDGQVLNVGSYDGGTVRIFPGSVLLETGGEEPTPWTPAFGHIQINNGGVLRLSGDLNADRITLQNGASLRSDGGVVAEIGTLTMLMSTAHIQSRSVNIRSATMDFASSLLIPRDGEGNSQIGEATVSNGSNLFEY